MDNNDLASELTGQLQNLVLESGDLDKFLNELAVFSSQILDHSAKVEVGVILMRHKRAATVAASSEEARSVDEIQHGFGVGPCLHAAATGEVTVVEDVRSEQRWPKYFQAIAESGYFSILGVPLDLGEAGSSAALDFYATKPNVFTPEIVRLAEEYALHAARALQLSVRVAASTEKAAHLQAAMEARTVIDLAVGIIIAQNRCSQDKAIEILKNAASNQNVKMRVLAQQLVTSVATQAPSTHFDA